jgi:hypothetical protein
LRRIVLIVTALVVLGAAASAYAALNTYTASLTFTSKQAGTAKQPVPIGYTQNIKAANVIAADRTAVLSDITTKIYGLTADGKDFPTCAAAAIAHAQNDTICPKAAEVATGYITATLGESTDFTVGGSACDPYLDVWNSGPGKLTFFFVDTPPNHICLGGDLKTGGVGPYKATDKVSGKFLVVDVPIPNTVDYPLGKAGGLAGSLETEHLVWMKHTKKVGGKTVAAISSVACKGNKRPYSMSFTANLPTTGAVETKTVSGSGPC